MFMLKYNIENSHFDLSYIHLIRYMNNKTKENRE